jgi:hypothetical protein
MDVRKYIEYRICKGLQRGIWELWAVSKLTGSRLEPYDSGSKREMAAKCERLNTPAIAA